MRPDSQIQWNAYPALLLAGCLAAGIGGAALVSIAGFDVWIAGVVAGCAVVLGARHIERGRLVTPAPVVRTLGVALMVVSLGGARFAIEQGLPTHHLAHSVYSHGDDGMTASLRGRVADVPVKRPYGLRFRMTAHSIAVGGDTLGVTGQVQVTLAQPRWKDPVRYPTLERGDIVQLGGRLRPVPERRNPADFAYGRYLKRRGVYVTLSVYDTVGVAVLGQKRSWLEAIIVPVQAYIRTQLAHRTPTEEARAVLHALILGDRSNLEAETRDQFARTGLMHLLAVSGLHVLLVGMVLYSLLRPLLMRAGLSWQAVEITRASITMAVLLLYVFVAGAGPSVVRAVVMTGLFIGATLAQRTAHPLNTLGVAAVVLLLIRPSHLFDPGFQLSFAAVAAIVTLHPRVEERLPDAWQDRPALRYLLATMTVSLAATLGTMPVLLYHFGRVSMAGLLLNVVAIPLTFLVLASGLLTLVLGGWLAAGADVFGAASALLVRWLLGIAEAGDAVLGWASIQAYVHDPWYLLALAVGLVTLAQWPRPRLRWRLAATVVGLTGAGLWMGVLSGHSTPRLEVVFFDVGHGDAALVTLPNKRRVLIDAGGRDAYVDHGSRTILPHLERFGIDQLDAVVISHPHSDHLGGLPALLRNVPVGRVIDNGQSYPSALYAETRHLLDSLDVPHQSVHAGDTLAIDPSVLIQILAPEATAVSSEANEASVVLRLVYGNTSWLFTGDAEGAAEQRLVARYGPLLASDVVKVGHHGSRTSSTLDFVEHVVPDTSSVAFAVISVGAHGRFGLPDEEVVARWHTRGADLWTTRHRHALWLRSDGTRIRTVDW